MTAQRAVSDEETGTSPMHVPESPPAPRLAATGRTTSSMLARSDRLKLALFRRQLVVLPAQ